MLNTPQCKNNARIGLLALILAATASGQLLKPGSGGGGGSSAPDLSAEPFITTAASANLSNETVFVTRFIRDGLSVQYDPAPTSPNTEDDEFDSSTLNAKWAVITNDAAAVDIDTTWQSHVFVKFTGDQSYEIEQDYAPAGDFSLTAKFRYQQHNDFAQARLGVWNSDDTEGVALQWQFVAGSGGRVVRLVTTTTGTPSVVSELVIDRTGVACLHVERDGTTFSTWFSPGESCLNWRQFGTATKTLTVDHLELMLDQTGATAPQIAGIDWVRRDYLDLN